jgi:phosphoglycolate phosphatase-like HAD superfamily hydrolase
VVKPTFLFDLDGTMWDSAPWYAALAISKSGSGEESVLAAALRTGSAGANAASVLKAAGYHPTSFARACAERVDELALYEGARSTLDRLYADGVQLAVVTNLPSWVADPMLNTTGVRDRLSSVICWSRGRAKPRPHGLRDALGQMMASPEGATYLGDGATDAVAAEAAGVHFLWAAWGYEDESPPNALPVNSWKDLVS